MTIERRKLLQYACLSLPMSLTGSVPFAFSDDAKDWSVDRTLKELEEFKDEIEALGNNFEDWVREDGEGPITLERVAARYSRFLAEGMLAGVGIPPGIVTKYLSGEILKAFHRFDLFAGNHGEQATITIEELRNVVAQEISKALADERRDEINVSLGTATKAWEAFNAGDPKTNIRQLEIAEDRLRNVITWCHEKRFQHVLIPSYCIAATTLTSMLLTKAIFYEDEKFRKYAIDELGKHIAAVKSNVSGLIAESEVKFFPLVRGGAKNPKITSYFLRGKKYYTGNAWPEVPNGDLKNGFWLIEVIKLIKLGGFQYFKAVAEDDQNTMEPVLRSVECAIATVSGWELWREALKHGDSITDRIKEKYSRPVVLDADQPDKSIYFNPDISSDNKWQRWVLEPVYHGPYVLIRNEQRGEYLDAGNAIGNVYLHPKAHWPQTHKPYPNNNHVWRYFKKGPVWYFMPMDHDKFLSANLSADTNLYPRIQRRTPVCTTGLDMNDPSSMWLLKKVGDRTFHFRPAARQVS